MSYHPFRKQDSLNEYFSQLSDFELIKNKLIDNSKDYETFVMYFDKALKIDARSTFRFIKNKQTIFSKDIQAYLSDTLDRGINYKYDDIE